MTEPMTGEVLRAATDADLGAVAAMVRRAVDFDPPDGDDLALVLAEEPPPGHVGVAGRGPTLGVVADRGGTVVGAAYGVVTTGGEEPPEGALVLVAVDPDHRGRGLGRALLAALERRLVDAGAAVLRTSGPSPRYLWPGVDVRATDVLCLLESTGYVRDGEAISMTVDLAAADLATAEDEARLAAAGITVAPLAETDLEVFASFMSSWEAAWHAEAVAGLRRDGTCEVAWREGVPIGFAAAGGTRRTFFGPMGTLEEARGTGVGRVLLRRCLRDLAAAGHHTAEISWVGPVRFYSRAVGARIERVCWQLSKPVP